jgi:hypothetical protein
MIISSVSARCLPCWMPTTTVPVSILYTPPSPQWPTVQWLFPLSLSRC